MTTTGMEHTRVRYLPLLWPVRQSGAAVEHNDFIVTLGLLNKQHIMHTPISHVSLVVSYFTYLERKYALYFLDENIQKQSKCIATLLPLGACFIPLVCPQ